MLMIQTATERFMTQHMLELSLARFKLARASETCPPSTVTRTSKDLLYRLVQGSKPRPTQTGTN